VDDRDFPTQLSASDSLMWRIESDPVLRSPILVVGLLDRSPPPERLEAAVERAAAALPRLRQRIVPPPLGVGRPRWEDAGEPSLAHHVRRVRAPGDDLDSVLEVAQPDAVAAFDPARPPWALTVVEGLTGGRAAFVLRFHHAITDGVGGIEIAHLLFDRTRNPRGGASAAGGAAAPASGGTAAEPPLQRLVGATAGGAARLARAAAGAARRPGDVLATPVRMGRSAVRMMSTSGDGSPELAGRSLDRWLATTERPLGRMRAAARATGGTVNDVLLASVAGALSSYHRQQGRPVTAVRVTMPISIRRADDRIGGNHFVPARFTLPVDDPDPGVRVQIAGAIVRGWRAEPALGATDLLATGLNLLPQPVVTRLFGGMLRSIDVDVVDVPGLDRAAFFAGARLDRLWAFAPPTGAALSITLVSHGPTACIGLACDRLAVADPELMAECLDRALDELVALGRSRSSGGRPSRSRAASRPADATGPARSARSAKRRSA
jgi:diacylglycerol O-acyltransferase / wax synthase